MYDIFEPTREAAIMQLELFIENFLSNYSLKRNYDFGPYDRTNTSCISPYISHGVLSENEIIKKVLNKYSILKLKNLYKKFYGEHIEGA